MQSLTAYHDTSNISLGERRGKSDLARFSLDLSWGRAVSDSARIRAYPSPPMSGSPPLPPRRNPEASDRGHGSYGSSGQGVFQGTQASQLEQQQHSEPRGPPLRYPADPAPPAPYPTYRIDDMQTAQLHFQQQSRAQLPPQQQAPHHSYPPHPSQPSAPFSTPDRPPIREAPEYSSPKQQRKTKGHVASACVPCKRAHLRCDAQRPCSRCLSNGKEDACVDVQHKKRGRPRLRDEREARYEGVGPGYPPPEASMRRPISFNDGQMVPGFGDPLHRSASYRVLKSQVGSMPGPIAPRYIDWANTNDANIYGGSMTPTPRMMPPQEPICAYLNMEMQIAKTTQNFGDTVVLQPIVGRKLQDIVAGNDREKILRLQRNFEEERREREPNYLPPIYLHKFEEDRAIQSVGFGQEEIGQVRTDHSETLTFPGSDGQQRAFHVRLGLAKREATYFIVLILQMIPATPQQYHQPSTSPYTRDPYSRESQYGYQAAPQQQPYGSTQGLPQFVQNPGFTDPRGEMSAYRPPGPLGQTIPQAGNLSSYAPPQPARQEFSQGQAQFQIPRSELAQAPQQRQHDLQLPPIRDQGPPAGSMRPRDDRSGRVDIGGLLEKPNPGRSGI